MGPGSAAHHYGGPIAQLRDGACVLRCARDTSPELSARGRPGVAAGLREQPLRELAHMRLAGGEARLDDEIRPRSHQRLLERRDQRTGFDEIVEQRLAAERDALPADGRLDPLLVLAKGHRPAPTYAPDSRAGHPPS